MKHSLVVNGNAARVALTGKIYSKDAGLVRDAVLEQIDRGVTEVFIDLAEITYIDSTGLGVLITINKRTKEKNGKLIVSGVQGIAGELLRRTRLDKILTIS